MQQLLPPLDRKQNEKLLASLLLLPFTAYEIAASLPILFFIVCASASNANDDYNYSISPTTFTYHRHPLSLPAIFFHDTMKEMM